MSAPMTPEQHKAIAVQIGDVKPATDALIGSFAESVANVRNHEHPSWEDLYCMNLTSYMGERMAPVLKRLLDTETENARLRAEVARWRERTEEAETSEAQLKGRVRGLRARVAELETFAHGCDGEGCVLPHSSWCERAKKSAAENDGCTCPKPWPNSPQPHAGYCWLVSPPRDEVDEMRKRLAEDPHDSPLHHTYALSRDLPKVEPEQPALTAERWNAQYPVGTPVYAYPGLRPEDDPTDPQLTTRTRSKASVLGGHNAVVWVEGHGACISLTHVDPRPEGGAL
ncbi:hypothetical protein ACFZDM_33595 [Streptomyces californicus]|uniref:hypothetical protein n=1 Tax=Streptomyces californicus TaxID=67351 RepID=UPI0036E609E1